MGRRRKPIPKPKKRKGRGSVSQKLGAKKGAARRNAKSKRKKK
jgi:hypothetical protein